MRQEVRAPVAARKRILRIFTLTAALALLTPSIAHASHLGGNSVPPPPAAPAPAPPAAPRSAPAPAQGQAPAPAQGQAPAPAQGQAPGGDATAGGELGKDPAGADLG